jgi:EAL domain-containing protein (putative c-di-GMP-specific phosphodiesterase class I)
VARGKLNWTVDSLPAGAMPAPGVRSLTDAEIGVVFQPIVDIATGRLFAHEALVRCTRPEYVQPPVLFEHAVKEGACGRLGRKIRDAAFGTCGDVALFVNLHPEELSSRWLVRPDDPIGFHKRPVYLEITESATMAYFELCQSVLKELCVRTNARLVIDDFGAGYSNLERLILLEPAVVKLDLALTHDIHRERRKQIVTRHMINLCRDLGATVVAEGVETLDELECIRDLGVDYAQGYLLARPATPPPAFVWPLRGQASNPIRKGPPPLPLRKGPPPLPPAIPRSSQAPAAPSRRTLSGRLASVAMRRSKPPPDKGK